MPNEINITTETVNSPPMERIHISVSNLIAKNLNHSAIVRYNSGYRAVFDFDTNTGIEGITWADLTKYAKFIYNAPNDPHTETVELKIDETTGECYANIPIVTNGAECMLIGAIGVYQQGEPGETSIYTTTSAFVMCIESIQDLDNSLAPTDENLTTIAIDNTSNAGLGITNNGYLIFRCNQTIPAGQSASFDQNVLTNGQTIQYSAGRVIPIEASAEIDERTNDTLINLTYDLMLNEVVENPENPNQYIVGVQKLFVAYDTTPDPTIIDNMSLTYSEDKTYMGIVISEFERQFTKDEYTWIRIRANDGVRHVLVGETITGLPGTDADVSVDDTNPDSPVLTFTVPRGATVEVGDTITGDAGTDALVENVGQNGDVVLQFTIPQGADGTHPTDIHMFDEATTLTGNVVSFESEMDNVAVKEVSVNMPVIQDLHGETYPYPEGNLIDQSTAEIYYRFFSEKSGGGYEWKTSTNARSFAFSCLQNTIYTISVQADVSIFRVGYIETDLPGGGTYPDILESNLGSGPRAVTLTTSANAKYIIVQISASYIRTADLQIEFGSTATQFKQYPSNICPFIERTKIDIYNDPIYGGSINWNQLVKNGNFTNVQGNGTPTNWVINQNASAITTNNKTTIKSPNNTDTSYLFQQTITPIFRNKYYARVTMQRKLESVTAYSAVSGYGFKFGGFTKETSINNIDEITTIEDIFTVTEVSSNNLQIYKSRCKPAGTNPEIFTIWDVNVFNLTQMFGKGKEPSTIAEFKNLFPSDFYSWNTGEKTTVSAVNEEPYRHYTVNLPNTTYTGTANLTNGTLSYNNMILLGNSDLVWNYDSPDHPSRWNLINASKHIFQSRTDIGRNYIINSIHNASNKYKRSTATSRDAMNNYEIYFSQLQGAEAIYIRDDRYDNETDFTNASSDLQVLMEAVNSPVNAIMSTLTVRALAGQNNVWADDSIITLDTNVDITDMLNPESIGAASEEHSHGSITNAGAIGGTADQAVYTTTDGVLTAGSLAVADPTAPSGATSSTFISTISQDSKGQITATKAELPTASTSAAGVVILNDTTLNTMVNQLSDDNNNPQDSDYYISQYTNNGTTETHKRPLSKLFNYIKSKFQTEGTPYSPVKDNVIGSYDTTALHSTSTYILGSDVQSEDAGKMLSVGDKAILIDNYDDTYTIEGGVSQIYDFDIIIPNNTNVPYPIGTELELLRNTCKNVNIKKQANVVIHYLVDNPQNLNGIRIKEQWGVVALKKIDTNVWLATGSIEEYILSWSPPINAE